MAFKAFKHDKLQTWNNKNIFNYISYTFDFIKPAIYEDDINVVVQLEDDRISTFDNKFASTLALYIKLNYKDIKKLSLNERETL